MPKDSVLKRIGVSGYNKPKRTPNHPKKSHVVVAKEGDNVSITPLGLNEKNRLCTLSGLNIMYAHEKKEEAN